MGGHGVGGMVHMGEYGILYAPNTFQQWLLGSMVIHVGRRFILLNDPQEATCIVLTRTCPMRDMPPCIIFTKASGVGAFLACTRLMRGMLAGTVLRLLKRLLRPRLRRRAPAFLGPFLGTSF